MTGDLINGGVMRYARRDDEFWLDLIGRWETSGMGVRKFCEQNGVAPSTFHKRRAGMAKELAPASIPGAVTPDACFIAVQSDGAQAMPALRASAVPAPKQQARDSVVVHRGGMRIELSGIHADRIVRHLLGRLNGASC
jgi:hypothetical protein